MKKTAKDYLKEPYSRVLVPESDGTYSADILEFPGCFAEGKTPNEAYANLERIAESWIEAALEQGQDIPAPIEAHNFSGRNALRIPRSIHKQAAKFAKMEDTSLNQFFLTAIAARVGAEDFAERLYNRLEAKCVTFATALPSYTIWEIGSVNIRPTQNFFFELPEKSFISFEPGGLPMLSSSWPFLSEKEAENG
jgi:predicted RNase H-like HicB family nuclease